MWMQAVSIITIIFCSLCPHGRWDVWQFWRINTLCQYSDRSLDNNMMTYLNCKHYCMGARLTSLGHLQWHSLSIPLISRTLWPLKYRHNTFFFVYFWYFQHSNLVNSITGFCCSFQSSYVLHLESFHSRNIYEITSKAKINWWKS